MNSLRVQLVLVGRKRAFERNNTGIRHDMAGEMQERFVGALPFPLTGAQRRVIDEVNADLAKAVPMHRLLQGRREAQRQDGGRESGGLSAAMLDRCRVGARGSGGLQVDIKGALMASLLKPPKKCWPNSTSQGINLHVACHRDS